MQTIPDQIAQARVAFAEAPDERARMGRISGVLWMFSALVGMADVFVPGSHHVATPIVLAVGVAIFLYGLASVTGWIPWERATIEELAIGMVLTIPVAGLALILGIDRFMSEARALTNIIGNGVATIVIARWEGVLGENP